jgi:predicted dienelactone hydrolase
MRSFVQCCLMSILFASSLAHAAGAGLRLIELKDPVATGLMKAAVFYPSEVSGGTTKIGPLEIAATRDAPVDAGRHPLILLSHGNGGSMFSHYDMALALAQQGFVVAAIEHPGDNFRDASGQGSDRVLVGRNLQLSAVLDLLLSSPPWAALVDPQKVGVAGFSAGGYTALLMVGGRPKFELLKAHCARTPSSVLCRGGGSVSVSSPPLLAKADTRVRAAFVMSPVATFFDQDSLANISVPVHLYSAANDAVLPVQEHALRVRQALRTLTTYSEVAGADHFVFLAPCTAAMKSITPPLCTDPPGVDRQAVHEAVNRDAIAFFRTRLDGASASLPKRE